MIFAYIGDSQGKPEDATRPVCRPIRLAGPTPEMANVQGLQRATA